MPQRIGLIYIENATADSVKTILGNKYTILDYHTPETALAAVKKDPPELILILNSIFKGYYGPELVKAIRQICPREKMAIISFSVKGGEAMDVGDVFAHIIKPFDTIQLLDAVKRALGTVAAR